MDSKREDLLKEINLPVELKRLQAIGWIKSNRRGDTGIGKTIEDHLGIRENNLKTGDCIYRGKNVEIKAKRLETQSMITLFTLEPTLRQLKDVPLMNKYGYIDKQGRQALKDTLIPSDFNHGLKVDVDQSNAIISLVDAEGNKPWTWETSNIQEKLHKKLYNLCIIYAASKKDDGQEYFRIEKAVLATGLNVSGFLRLIANGVVKIDLRMHIKASGVSRNHGTGFRMRLSNYEDLMKCYKKKEILVDSQV